jgi:hypothetical protein
MLSLPENFEVEGVRGKILDSITGTSGATFTARLWNGGLSTSVTLAAIADGVAGTKFASARRAGSQGADSVRLVSAGGTNTMTGGSVRFEVRGRKGLTGFA